MKVGEEWAYSPSSKGYLSRVRIQKISADDVQVMFVDDDDADISSRKVKWTKLRVPWDDAREYARAMRVSHAEENAEAHAARIVFDQFIPSAVAELWGRGDSEVFDAPALAALSGISIDRLDAGKSDSHEIARSVAALNGVELLQYVDEEERKDYYEALRRAMNPDYGWWYLEKQDAMLTRVAREAGEMTRRRNWVLRTWAGQEAVDLVKENDQLKRDLLSARVVARRAIDALAREGRTQRAAKLVTDLEAALPPS